MKVSLARGELLDALSVAGRGLSSRSTLPILSGVLMSAEGETLTLQATDLEVSVRATAQARVDKPGRTVIPGKLLTDIVRTMPEAAVTLDNETPERVTVTCGQSSFTLRTLGADDFPRFPEIQPERTVELPIDGMSALVRQVGRAVSRDETRPVLTGVLVSVDEVSLRMVATDSYRLAIGEIILEQRVDEAFEVIVPGRALEEVTKMAGGSASVKMSFSDNQIVFELGTTLYISRRIEGNFPNYRALLPKEHETTVVIDRQELLDSVKRVSLLAQHNAPLRFAVSDATVSLSAQTPDVGEAKEDLMASTEGTLGVEIAFNPAFFVDGVSASDSETVAIELTGSLKPAILKPSDGSPFTYLIMPVRIG
jgi:DNA polymerase-3 subunit beta